MKPFPCSLLFCVSLLFSDVAHATYHLKAGDSRLKTAQSYAQTRHNAQPVLRTLNPANHRSDYTYRGRYHYHYQPPRIPPPVVYRPLPLSPPVTYHRPPLPMLPYHHRFNGPAAPHLHHTYRGLSPPVAQPQPQHRVKGPWPYKPRGPCPTRSAPVAAILVLPTLPRHTVRPTFPAATETPVTFIVTTASPVETPALWKQPVSTQSGLITTISPVETGLDPCAMGHDCEHICINSNASFYCKCQSGYVLNADKKTCSPKQARAEVVEDPCKCEAMLVFQRQTQATIQQLTAKLADISGRIEHLENMLGRA
ncbi:matrilin-3a isoform X4 [Poecilia reticulata]|uniref:matrilin-3a isoform X4 n=1 Tax=Poecilia reticulata TaxID=8081 RepID=UPI0007EB2169|nr:PREDICTED: matrilin-3 isoform X4 [Poecilia reticulata]